MNLSSKSRGVGVGGCDELPCQAWKLVFGIDREYALRLGPQIKGKGHSAPMIVNGLPQPGNPTKAHSLTSALSALSCRLSPLCLSSDDLFGRTPSDSATLKASSACGSMCQMTSPKPSRLNDAFAPVLTTVCYESFLQPFNHLSCF